jgi:hypothetical protein
LPWVDEPTQGKGELEQLEGGGWVGYLGGAALGGVADQREVAALEPRWTANSKTPSSGEGLPEDPVTGYVSNRTKHMELKIA